MTYTSMKHPSVYDNPRYLRETWSLRVALDELPLAARQPLHPRHMEYERLRKEYRLAYQRIWQQMRRAEQRCVSCGAYTPPGKQNWAVREAVGTIMCYECMPF